MQNETYAASHSCPVHRHLGHMRWLLDEWPWLAALAVGAVMAMAVGLTAL